MNDYQALIGDDTETVAERFERERFDSKYALKQPEMIDTDLNLTKTQKGLKKIQYVKKIITSPLRLSRRSIRKLV